MERLVGASCPFPVVLPAQEEEGKGSTPRDPREGKDRRDCDESVRKRHRKGCLP